MARRVLFSFKYKDVSRVMVVRNSWVTQGKEAAEFFDAVEFEKVERQGDQAIKNWFNKQFEVLLSMLFWLEIRHVQAGGLSMRPGKT